MNRNNLNRSQTDPRSAFTLIELLLVISVIAVLASLSVNVIASAQQDARVAATRARVTLIQSVMEVELEDYEVRRSPVSFRAIRELTAAVPNTVWANSGPGDQNFLLHAKNLKRMIVADLIRSEMPSGRGGQPMGFGRFPSDLFRNYLLGLSIPPSNIADIERDFGRVQPANVARWNGFTGFMSTPASPSVRQQFADSAEILYVILSQLEFEGTSALDALGSSAIGDTDSDNVPEIIDAFGDPMSFEFHQVNVAPVPAGSTGSSGESGVWATPAGELEMTNFEVVNPVLPTDLRFFVTSETLLEIDGQPEDLQ